MRQYKLILILKSTLKEADRKKLLTSVSEMLGKVKSSKTEEMGQKALAYPIQKEVSGIYAKMDFESEGISQDFEKKLYVNENILRHLLIRE